MSPSGLTASICSDQEVEVPSGVIAKDYVHMLMSFPPQISVSKLVQKLKSESSYKLQREFSSLRKEYWGQRMWACGYFACSTGNVSDDMVKAYLASHADNRDDFHWDPE